jgi:GT2 family glycosyltransferase
MSRPFTAARARNEGFAALISRWPNVKFVQFIDGDCELDQGWFNKGLDFISQSDQVAVVCGRRRERDPTASIYNQLCDIEWDTPVGEAAACGGDSLVRVQAFRDVGGFDAQLIAAEEPELCIRMREKGWKIWRIDAEMTNHDAAMRRLSQWWVRSVRSGYGMMQVLDLHRRSPFRIWTRDLLSATFWAGLVPGALILATFVNRGALAGLLIYPIQLCRLALHRARRDRQALTYSYFMVLGQFAVFQGILRYWYSRLTRTKSQLIEYK